MPKDEVLEQEIYKELLRIVRSADSPEQKNRLIETTRRFKLPEKLKRTAERELAVEDGRRRGRNPYFHRGRIDDPTAFVGRARELTELERTVVGPARVPTALVGERRIGKSSLAAALERRIRDGDGVRVPIARVDALEIAPYDPDAFFEVLTRALVAAGAENGLGMVTPKEDVSTTTATPRPLHHPQLVIVVDEFDALLDNAAFDEKFFVGLADLARLPHIAMLLLSVAGPTALVRTHGARLARIAATFTEFRLGPLTHAEARELIAIPSARENYPLLPYAERIQALSGRFPLTLQIVCAIFFDELAETLGQSPVRETMVRERALDESASYLRYLVSRLAADERAILERAPLPASAANDPAVRHLERRGYLELNDDKLEPFSSLVPKVLPGRHKLARTTHTVRFIYAGLTLLALVPVALLVFLFAFGSSTEHGLDNPRTSARALKGEPSAAQRPVVAPRERIAVEIRHVDPEVGLPSAIHAIYRFKEVPFAKVKLRNNGDTPVTIKISHQIKQRTHLLQETFELGPDDERKVPLYVTFQSSVFKSFTSDQTGNYFEIRVERIRPDGSVEPLRVETGFLKVLANNRFSPLFSYLGEEGGVSLWDTLVAWVEEGQVRDVLVKARQRDPTTPFIGYQSPASFNLALTAPKAQTRQVRALYEALVRDFKIDYSNSPEVEGHLKVDYSLTTQVVKFPAQTLKERGGNCIELSILMASTLRLVELDPLLVLFPTRGHAIVAWRIRERDRERFVAFDTNHFGHEFERAVQAAEKLFDFPELDARAFKSGRPFSRQLLERGLYFNGADLARSSVVILDVKRLQESGLRPIKM
ncbi:MAG: hypothetical protein HYY84_18560 [Deltaproteobacteria bacterium]|nr:hypothetical protein [Deltaproteobacteria bacterium]